jgi:hypothetical protein
VIISAELSAERLSVFFPAPKDNFLSYIFKDDREEETIVTK